MVRPAKPKPKTKPKPKLDFASLGVKTRASGERLVEQDKALEEKREQHTLKILRISDIKPRANLDTRKLKPNLVVELLHSISKLGLIEPLAVDREHRLLAGGHRLMALRMLWMTSSKAQATLQALKPDPKSLTLLNAVLERFNREEQRAEIPVHVFDFDSEEEPQRALEIETAENTVRRDYTPGEVFRLYQRLAATEGYITRGGRPNPGERPVIPELAAILGKSVPTIHRYLKQAQAKEAAQHEPEQEQLRRVQAAYLSFQRAADKLKREGAELPEVVRLLSFLESKVAAQAQLRLERRLSLESVQPEDAKGEEGPS